jgi:hypothetical protein
MEGDAASGLPNGSPPCARRVVDNRIEQRIAYDDVDQKSREPRRSQSALVAAP